MRSKTLPLVAAILLLAGCPATYPPPAPTQAGGGAGAPPPRPSPPPVTAGDSGAPDGAACEGASECASGVCEGQGCGPGDGVCAAAGRRCTRDLREYCGCDGVTFRSSGSCPGRRFETRGSCEVAGASETGAGAGAVELADGQPCSDGAECASGICEGRGCGDAAGKCKPRNRPCTTDYVAHCDCDGQTFFGSSSCPGRLYTRRGEC